VTSGADEVDGRGAWVAEELLELSSTFSSA
jgi:hypothetical protein